MKFTQEQIIAGIRNRKNEVFIHLDKVIKRPILAHVALNRGSDEDGEDCFNDSLIVLMKIVDRHDFKNTCKISTLLFDIAKVQWLKKLEKRGPANNYKVRHNLDTIVEQDIEEIDKPIRQKIFDEC